MEARAESENKHHWFPKRKEKTTKNTRMKKKLDVAKCKESRTSIILQNNQGGYGLVNSKG